MQNKYGEEIESLWGNLDYLDLDKEDDWEEIEDDLEDEDHENNIDWNLLHQVIKDDHKKKEDLAELERQEELKNKGLDSLIFDPKDLYLPDSPQGGDK
ncbi:MAG: hypothetical protein ACTSX1_06630 [Candidatus Heimdallarchaeaceae archaeon]